MITLANIYSVAYDAVKRRIVSIFQFGAKTTFECAPFGDDSNPLQGMTAIYADTSNDNAPVLLGYVNTNQLAAPGEKRCYSMTVDPETNIPSQAFYTWMKADGTYEIGGAINHLLRYEQLNAALQGQVVRLQGELVKISAGIATGGGVYTPGDISLDISAAMIDEIKTL